MVVVMDKMSQMFFLFNNRLGCLGSVLASVIGTAVLVVILVLVNGR